MMLRVSMSECGSVGEGREHGTHGDHSREHPNLLTAKLIPLIIPQPTPACQHSAPVVPYSCSTRRWCSPGRSTTIAAVCPGASPSVTTWGANSPAATRAHAKSWRPAEYHCRMSAASPSSWAAAELCPDWPRTARLRFDECPWRSSGGSSSCARGAPANSAHNTRTGVLLAYPHLPRVRSVERRVITRAPLPLKVNDDLVDQTRGLSLDMPI